MSLSLPSDLEGLKAKVITPGTLVGLYDVKEVIGKGGFATVRKGVDRKSGQQVALKLLNPKGYLRDPRQARQVFQEIEILQKLKELKNPNLLQFFAAHEDVSATTGLPRLTIVTQLCEGGELFDRIVSRGHFSEKDAAELIKKLAKSLDQLHKAGIVHRDLKPENILYSTPAGDAEPVLADFGLSLVKGREDLHNGIIGTPAYLSPEIINFRRYTEAADVWALGHLLYILLCGYPAFYSEKRNPQENHAELYAQIRAGAYAFHADAWGDISEVARLLVAQMMTVDESKRISISGILAHPWIAANTNDKHLGRTLDNLRQFNAKRKIRAAALAVRVGATATNLKAKMTALMRGSGADASAPDSIAAAAAAFTPAKLTELSVAFNKVAGQGGSVNAAQLSSVLSSLGLSHLPVDRIFELFDEDGSGDIDYRELLMGLTTLSGANAPAAATPEDAAKDEEASLRMAFGLFDADGNGSISLPELIRLLQMLDLGGITGAATAAAGASPASGAGEGAGAAPSSSSSFITAGAAPTDDEEEKKLVALEALFNRIDVNGDGKLSYDEFRSAVKGEAALADALLKPLRRAVSTKTL